MARAEREPITGVWGGASSGFEGPGQWVPSEAENLLAFGCNVM